MHCVWDVCLTRSKLGYSWLDLDLQEAEDSRTPAPLRLFQRKYPQNVENANGNMKTMYTLYILYLHMYQCIYRSKFVDQIDLQFCKVCNITLSHHEKLKTYLVNNTNISTEKYSLNILILLSTIDSIRWTVTAKWGRVENRKYLAS